MYDELAGMGLNVRIIASLRAGNRTFGLISTMKYLRWQFERDMYDNVHVERARRRAHGGALSCARGKGAEARSCGSRALGMSPYDSP